MLRSAHAARACQQLRGAALRCPQRLGPRRARALSGARGAADGARADDPDGERDGGGGAVRVVYEADVDMRFRLLGAFGVCQGGFWGVFMYLNVAQPLPGTESPLAYAALGTAFSGGYVALAHAFASHSVKRLALARSAPPAGAFDLVEITPYSLLAGARDGHVLRAFRRRIFTAAWKAHEGPISSVAFTGKGVTMGAASAGDDGYLHGLQVLIDLMADAATSPPQGDASDASVEGA